MKPPCYTRISQQSYIWLPLLAMLSGSVVLPGLAVVQARETPVHVQQGSDTARQAAASTREAVFQISQNGCHLWIWISCDVAPQNS